MSATRRALAALPILAAGLEGACARPAAPASAPLPPALPELPVPIARPTPLDRAPTRVPGDPLAGIAPGKPITLSARNVDVRTLLPAIAEQAGVSLVIDPSVQARVTVNFTAVPALEALRAVLAAAGLGLASGPPEPPIGATVFYAAPIDIERASAALIEERFGVSPEVARWIVANRVGR